VLWRHHKGALGNTRDLVVSPQHGILIEDYRAELLFGEHSVLARAKDLVDDVAIYRREGGWVTYYHLLLPHHALVFAEGIPSESFLPGRSGIATLDDVSRESLFRAMPRLRRDPDSYGSTVRMSLKKHEVRCLMAA